LLSPNEEGGEADAIYTIINIARFELTGNDKSCFACRRITLRMGLTNTGGYKKQYLIVITVND